ncbi:MAG: arginine repressor [Planctomycetes bacterium]|nr:arginine repressor [Planctomycetota bacterium]
MKEKLNRQSEIAKIIKKHQVFTQDGLLKHLKHAGIRVTQATLSRDIAEMGIVQVPGLAGRYYQMPSAVNVPVAPAELIRRFGSYVATIKHSGNLIVVTTLPGEASGAARLVDELNFKEILGTIAGDDTVLIVADGNKSVSKIMSVLKVK